VTLPINKARGPEFPVAPRLRVVADLFEACHKLLQELGG